MAENIEHLMLEQFRLIRSDIALLRDEVRGLKTEMVAVRMHVRGNELDVDTHRDSIAKLQSRVDRIERRLELVDDKN